VRPLDPRLLRYASAARTFLALGGVVAFAQAAGIVAFSWLVTTSVTGAIEGRGLAELAPTLGALALVIACRAALALAQDTLGARGAARIKSQLRESVLESVTDLGPGWLGSHRSAQVVTVLGRGIDALDGYFSRYVPQLLLTAIVTPILLLAVLTQDVLSAIILAVCLPLVPVFMILIGWATGAAQKRQWEELTALSTGFDDMIGGLSTLKAYGRQHRQVDRLRTITRRFRVRTMAVLRVSFLSSFALELAASLSVALVALTIGLRLVAGELDLVPGLFVLLLAPEVFLPLRQVGVNFHAASEGVEASTSLFAILDDARASARPGRGASASEEASAGLRFEGVSIAYDGRVVLSGLTAEARPGELTVLAGPSGSGKSSLVSAVLGFVPFEGRISVAGRHVTAGSSLGRAGLAWSGQAATLFPGTVAQNIALGATRPDDQLVREALGIAALGSLDPLTVLGEEGSGLSGGQSQRVAIARAIYRALEDDTRVLLLDEPSAALDHQTERQLIASLRDFARAGRTVVVVSHRDAFLTSAEALITVAPVGEPAIATAGVAS
jgi:ATP-binding cassette subfamily C protein CydD